MKERQKYWYKFAPDFADDSHSREIFTEARAIVADYLELLRLIDDSCCENKAEKVKSFEALYDAMLEVSYYWE